MGARRGAGRKRKFTNNEAMRALRRFIRLRKIPPTVAEFAEALGVGSTRTAMRYLKALEKEGRIIRWRGSRGLSIVRFPNEDSTAIIEIDEKGNVYPPWAEL